MKLKKRVHNWWEKHSDKRSKFRTYWKNLMSSTQEKLSHGAASIMKLIPFARKDNWRRKDKR